MGFQLSSHPESEIWAPFLKPNNVRYLSNIGVSAILVVISVVIVVGAVSSTILPSPPNVLHILWGILQPLSGLSTFTFHLIIIFQLNIKS